LENIYSQAGVTGDVERNSSDVLIPAFIAAYTGQNPNKVGLDIFPSLFKLLPNWKATYEGLMQIPVINKHFKSFTIEHEYKSRYTVGSYTSYPSWDEVNNSGIGYIRNMASNQDIPSSPYNVMAVSITEDFAPLIRVNSVLLNNMSVKLDYSTRRTVNLNIASYQIVEMSSKELSADLGYRIDHFDKVIHFPKKTNPNFNNDLRVSAGVSYRMAQSLNRKIQDAFTQPTSGDSQVIIKFTADYNLSKMIMLQGFFDREISQPLVSSTAFPRSKSSFGLSVKVSLMQ
jgi:cell surface protein SprA